MDTGGRTTTQITRMVLSRFKLLGCELIKMARSVEGHAGFLSDSLAGETTRSSRNWGCCVCLAVCQLYCFVLLSDRNAIAGQAAFFTVSPRGMPVPTGPITALRFGSQSVSQSIVM
eukprot:Selendium_serpulae@DN3571_c0_g1_i4.p1